jgi:MOSC domain
MPTPPTASSTGVVEAIYISPAKTELPVAVDQAAAVAGRGLEGDRYFYGVGTYSDYPDQRGRDLTLIETDALEHADIDGASARRNLTISGLALADLVDRRFLIGDVECLGRRLCEPCDHLTQLTHPGVLRALAHTGLRADILTNGHITRGDSIHLLD